MGLTAVTPGDVATIVTSLEMTKRPPVRPQPPSHFHLIRWYRSTPAKYRALFSRVGSPWLWFSRVIMADRDLTAIIHDEAVHIFAVTDRNGIEVGMLELDFRKPKTCEIAYFGLIPEIIGRGHGRWLMANALNLAWKRDVSRVWVHTCTLDHPSALPFYIRNGFVPFARLVETFQDPRITGILPRDTAPHIPLLDPPSWQ